MTENIPMDAAQDATFDGIRQALGDQDAAIVFFPDGSYTMVLPDDSIELSMAIKTNISLVHTMLTARPDDPRTVAVMENLVSMLQEKHGEPVEIIEREVA